MNLLKLTCLREDDGTAELSAFVQGDGFAGSGSAWFNLVELEAFCSSLSDYPLNPSALPLIQGGYRSGVGALEQRSLAIGLAPYDGRGGLKVTVELAELLEENDPADRLRSVITWFVIGYNDLKQFQTAFENLLNSRAKEAVLTPAPT